MRLLLPHASHRHRQIGGDNAKPKIAWQDHRPCKRDARTAGAQVLDDAVQRNAVVQ
jgi:hypothetical protein